MKSISRVQCPGGWLERGDLCLYEVFFTFTLLITVLVVILVILILLFLIFYTNELFLRRFCKRRLYRGDSSSVAGPDKSLPAAQTAKSCCAPLPFSSYYSSCSTSEGCFTSTISRRRLRSPDLTYRSLYSCDWSTHHSALLSQYNPSTQLSQDSGSTVPSSQSTTCTPDLSLVYSQVNKGTSFKCEEKPSCEAADADAAGETGDEVDWMEEISIKRLETTDWKKLEDRQLTLEEILALETEFLPPSTPQPVSLPPLNDSYLSDLDGDTDYPYFCREGRATVRRPVLINPNDDPPMTSLLSPDQERTITDATFATGAPQHGGLEVQAKIVIYVGLQLARLWQVEQEGCSSLI